MWNLKYYVFIISYWGDEPVHCVWHLIHSNDTIYGALLNGGVPLREKCGRLACNWF
jgi:hypothetical protein